MKLAAPFEIWTADQPLLWARDQWASGVAWHGMICVSGTPIIRVVVTEDSPPITAKTKEMEVEVEVEERSTEEVCDSQAPATVAGRTRRRRT